MLLRSKLFLLSPAPHPSTARGRWTKSYAGVIKVLEVNAALQQTLFFRLRLPIHALIEGGEPNDMLGVIKVLGHNSPNFSICWRNIQKLGGWLTCSVVHVDHENTRFDFRSHWYTSNSRSKKSLPVLFGKSVNKCQGCVLLDWPSFAQRNFESGALNSCYGGARNFWSKIKADIK